MSTRASASQQTSGPAALGRSRWWRSAFVIALVLMIGIGTGLVLFRWRRSEGVADQARTAVRMGEYESAGPLIERWLAAEPRSGEAHAWRARLALAQERPGEFNEQRQKALDLGCPSDVMDQLDALIGARRGRHREAEAVLRRAYEGDPRPDLMVEETLARIYLENYELTRAAAVCDRWCRDFPRDAKPYLCRVEIDRRLEGHAKALIDDYRAALERDPTLDQAWLGLANELRKAHFNDEAAEAYNAFLKIKPDDPEGLLGAGRNARELRDEAQAERFLDRALAHSPESSEILSERADLHLRRNELPMALLTLEQAVAIDPYDVTIRYNRSLALRRMGRTDLADREQAVAARLREENAELSRMQSSLAKAPGNRALQIQIARWLFDHGHGKDAVRWAEKIVRDQPGHPDACRLLAQYYDQIGNPGLANSYRAQILESPR